MKYLLCITEFSRGGGAQKQLYWIANALGQNDEVKVLVLKSKKYQEDTWYFIDQLRMRGITIYILSEPDEFHLSAALRKALSMTKEFRPDIVISFMFHAIILMRFVRLFTHFPVLIDSYRNAKEPRRLRRILVHCSGFLSDAMIYNSADHSLRLTSENKAFTIFNIIDDIRRSPDIQKEDRFNWISVCRLIKHKNVDVVLRSIRMLVDKGYDPVLNIYSDGPDAQKLKSLTKELVLEDRVFFHGVVSDIQNRLNLADGFVLISSWEGLSNSMLEAGLLELPMVLTPVSGVKDIFGDRLADTTVPFRDAEATTLAMATIMDMSSGERAALGSLLRDDVLDKCDADRCITRWKELTEHLWNTKGKC